jgi:hypothetical protein
MSKRKDIDGAVLRRLVAEGHSDGDIARILGCSISYIGITRNRRGIDPAKPRSTEAKANIVAAQVRRLALEIPRGIGGDRAFALAIGVDRFDDHPRLRPSGQAAPRPLPMPGGIFSGCGNAAMMCAAQGDGA